MNFISVDTLQLAAGMKISPIIIGKLHYIEIWILL